MRNENEIDMPYLQWSLEKTKNILADSQKLLVVRQIKQELEKIYSGKHIIPYKASEIKISRKK